MVDKLVLSFCVLCFPRIRYLHGVLEAIQRKPLEYKESSGKSLSCPNYRAEFHFAEVEEGVIQLDIFRDNTVPETYTTLIFDSEGVRWYRYNEDYLATEDVSDEELLDRDDGEDVVITSKRAQELTSQLLEEVKKAVSPANQGQLVSLEPVSA